MTRDCFVLNLSAEKYAEKKPCWAIKQEQQPNRCSISMLFTAIDMLRLADMRLNGRVRNQFKDGSARVRVLIPHEKQQHVQQQR